MKNTSRKFWSTSLAFVLTFLLSSIASADQTGFLTSSSDGTYLQWTPSVGSTHYTLVDESNCNGNTDYNSTNTVGNRDSYGIDISSLPNAATITQIEIQPCASRNKGGAGSATMNVFYRFEGVNSVDAGSYALSGMTPTQLATTTFSSLSHDKGPSSTLEIGAVLSAGTKGARLGRIAVRLTYTPLVAPSSLTATTISTTQIDLGWLDNSSNEDGFKIERSTDGTGSFVEIASVGANVVTHSDTTVIADHVYYYRVRAFNGGGNSSYSNTASAHTYTVPTAPSNLTATATGSSITLNWTDNSSNESSFKIERKINTGSFLQIVATAANVITYIDGPLGSGIYTYRVRASNIAGDSAYSNEAGATIP